MRQCPSCGGICPQIPPKNECKKQSLSNSDDAPGSVCETDFKYLKELSQRLNSAGFSWQHSDYFTLKEILPKLIKTF